MAKLPKHPPKAVNPPPPPYEDLRPSASSAAENAGPTNTSDSRPNIIQTHNETNTFIYNLAHRNIRVNDVSAKDPEVCSCCSVITFIVAATIISVVLTKIYHVGAFSQDDDHNEYVYRRVFRAYLLTSDYVKAKTRITSTAESARIHLLLPVPPKPRAFTSTACTLSLTRMTFGYQLIFPGMIPGKSST